MASAPVVLGIIYDPGNLLVMWRKESVTGLTGYQVKVKDSGGTETPYPAGPNDDKLPIPLDITGKSGYSVAVAAVVNGQPGEFSPWYGVLTVAPTMQLVTYNTDPAPVLNVQWEQVTQSGVGGYVAVLAKAGGGETKSSTTSDTKTHFEGSLDGSYNLTVRATDATQIIQGPPTKSYAPLTEAPTMQLITYDIDPSAVLNVQWRKVSESGVGGYVAVLSKSGGGGTKTSFTSATKTHFDGSLDGTYNVTVRPTDSSQIVQGPPTPVYVPLTQAPTMTLVSYNTVPSAKLELKWDLMHETGVDGYITSLTQSGSDPQTQYTTQDTASYEQTVDSTYSANVRASDSSQVVRGPPSTSYVPLVVSANVKSLSYDDGQHLKVDWDAFQGDSRIDGSQVVITGLPPFNEQATGPATVPVQLTGNSNDVVVRPTSGSVLVGPQGSGLVAITAIPAAEQMIWNRNQFSVQWGAVSDPSVTEYQIILSINGTAQPAVCSPISPCTIPQPQLDANTQYESRIQASKPNVTGPFTSHLIGPYRASVALKADTQGRLTREKWNGLATIDYTIDPAGNISAVTPTSSARAYKRL
jgi:hypothetical protein